MLTFFFVTISLAVAFSGGDKQILRAQPRPEADLM
jgi:hypothetical protein